MVRPWKAPAGAASGGAGDLHRVFQRFGTGVHQHRFTLGAAHRGEFAELLAQLHVGRVGNHRRAGVHDFAVGVPQFGVFGALGKLGGRRGGTVGHEAVFQVVQFLVSHHRSLYRPPTQTYFSSVNSSRPWWEPSRPSPDSFTPPNGASSVEIKPSFTPTMPYSNCSMVRQMRR